MQSAQRESERAHRTKDEGGAHRQAEASARSTRPLPPDDEQPGEEEGELTHGPDDLERLQLHDGHFYGQRFVAHIEQLGECKHLARARDIDSDGTDAGGSVRLLRNNHSHQIVRSSAADAARCAKHERTLSVHRPRSGGDRRKTWSLRWCRLNLLPCQRVHLRKVHRHGKRLPRQICIALERLSELRAAHLLHTAVGEGHVASADVHRRIGDDDLGTVGAFPDTDVDVAFTALRIDQHLLGVQLLHHRLEVGRKLFAVVVRKHPRRERDLFKVADTRDARCLRLRLAQGRQQHPRENRQNGEGHQHAHRSGLPAANGRADERDQEQSASTENDDRDAIFLKHLTVVIREPAPRVAQIISRPALHGHAAVEAGEPLRRGHVELPFGVGIRHVGLWRSEFERLRNRAGLQRRERLLVNDVHRERLIAVRIARQRDEQPFAVLLGLHRLVVHVAAPEIRARRQLELLKLLVVVLHHEAGLRKHLAFLGEHAGDLRAVGNGVQQILHFLVAHHVGVQREAVARVTIGEQHGPRDECPIRLGELSLVDEPERLCDGLGFQLQAARRGQREAAGLAFHARRVGSGEIERRLLGVELVIVSDDERVAAPRLVLERDGPEDGVGVRRGTGDDDGRVGFLAANVRPGELDVLPMRRKLHAKLLHSLIDDAVAHDRAAADQPIANGDQVKNVRDDARRQTFGRESERPFAAIGGVGEQFVGTLGQSRHRNLAQARDFASGLQANPRSGRRADLRRLIRRARDAERRERDLVGERLQRLFELHIQPSAAEHLGGETNAKFTIGGLPILHAFAAHVGDDEAGLRRQIDCVDAGLLDVERERVLDEQTCFFEPHTDAIRDLQHGLDATELRREREGTSVEAVGRERIRSGVHLAQAGDGIDLDDHILRVEREAAGLAFNLQRLRRDERGGGGRTFDHLLGKQRERVGLLDGFHKLDGEQLAVAFRLHAPVADLFTLNFRQRVAGRQMKRELGDGRLENVVAELRVELDHRGRDLRGGDGVHGHEGLARDLRRLALPAQGQLAIRSQKTFHA